jgi:splicing factor 3B subunit 3
VLDSVTGDMSDTRTRYIGSKPVKLFRILMQGNEAVRKTLLKKIKDCKISTYFQVLAMSSRTWLSYTYQGRFHLTPLSYESLEHASGFASEQCPEGIVAIAGNTLR